MAMILERQGNSLHRLYSQDEHLQHLNKAIENCEQASKQSLPRPIDQAHYLNALGVVLQQRYCYTKDADTDDLNRAIQYGLEAVKLVPPRFYQISAYLGNLSLFLSTRYSKNKDPEDLRNAISWGQKAWEATQCRPRDRIVACQATVFLLAAAQRWEEAKKLAMEACNLLSSITSHLESKADRACFAQVSPRVADTGCSVALQCQGPNAQHEALRILEMSRGTIHRLALTDFEDSVNHQDFSLASFSAHDADTLRVILNTTLIRTDAILIGINGDVQVLNLSGEIFQAAISFHGRLSTRFGFGAITEGEDEGEKWMQANDDMRIFLKWLWDMIVQPVLHLSGHDTSDDCPPYNACQPHTPDIGNSQSFQFLSDGQNRSQQFDDESKSAGYHMKQRIHWIGVGILSAFPFHAAGYGAESLKMNTMSHVISSSASTLKTLSLAKQKLLTLDQPGNKLLIVQMPLMDESGKRDLAQVEGNRIKKSARQYGVKVKRMESPSVFEVLEKLPECTMVHFACHGNADPYDPFESWLELERSISQDSDGAQTETNCLTAGRVASVKTERSQIAYLSTCHGAKNKVMDLLDEGIHLAGAFQDAGFPHVIASLWEADSKLSVSIAEEFYRSLFATGKIGNATIAGALHNAVRVARSQNDNPLSWAVMVHFGP